MTTEYSMAGKLLELLKQVAPKVTRLAVLRNSATPTGPAQFGIIQAMAPSLRVEVSPINVRDAAEIEQGINAFAHSSNDGLIVTAGGPAARHRDLIVALAARHNLPAVYFERSFVDIGGLVSYGADYLDQFRRTAGYVDRILKGEKPANLPVQAPTKYELVINLRAHGMACARRRIRRSRYSPQHVEDPVQHLAHVHRPSAPTVSAWRDHGRYDRPFGIRFHLARREQLLPIERVRHRRLRLHKILIPTRVLEITHLNLTS